MSIDYKELSKVARKKAASDAKIYYPSEDKEFLKKKTDELYLLYYRQYTNLSAEITEIQKIYAAMKSETKLPVTDTPRTDGAEQWVEFRGNGLKVVPSNISRNLERKNNELTEAVYMAIPFLEDACDDHSYKPGAAVKALKYAIDAITPDGVQKAPK